MYPSCLDDRGQGIDVTQSTTRGSDRRRFLDRPAADMAIGRVRVGVPRLDHRAGCR
jgi:hypothetical protein